jgi:hypothetical protein
MSRILIVICIYHLHKAVDLIIDHLLLSNDFIFNNLL